MRIYDQLEEMKEYIAEGDWDELEKVARKRCEKLAGKETTEKIAEIDLTEYTDELEEGLKRAYEEAEDIDALAVYFDYDMDNQWNGAFFLCHEYTPEEEEDDDWAADSDDELEGPAMPEMAALYAATFDASDKDRGVNGYLIARTVAAFGRVVDSLPDPENLAVCIGFHDQEGLLRIRENEDLEYDLDDDDDDDDDAEDEEE